MPINMKYVGTYVGMPVHMDELPDSPIVMVVVSGTPTPACISLRSR